jgi:hypothetical protein
MTALLVIALLSSALLVGGMAFFAAGVAPLVFRLLPPDHAARFLRGLFPVYYVWLIATAGAAAVALFPFSATAAGIMAAVAGLTVWLRQVLMPRINALSDRAKAGDAEAGVAFNRAHRLSVAANMVQLVAAGAVLAGFAI